MEEVYTVTGSPLKGAGLEKLKQFLSACELDYDDNIGFTVLLMEDGEIIAAGSLDGATVKCVAVSPAHQGEDLTGQIMTALMQKAAQDGHRHLMLYTKPRNQALFQPFGFHPVIRTPDCLLMENQRNGLNRFLEGLDRPGNSQGPVGCIVAHCNPFTLGHRWLIEQAAAECAWVHLFILSEDRGMFSAAQRLCMARSGCQDLSNVLVHPSGPYMVSSATFPTYFLKDKHLAGAVRCEVDVRLFGEKIAPALGITRRYAGTEPLCAVTAQYNDYMRKWLPEYGVTFCELERRTALGSAISASKVRKLLAENRVDELGDLLPASTLERIASCKSNTIPT